MLSRNVMRHDRICDVSDTEGLNSVQFLTVAEVADLIRVSKMTVYRLVHNGDLPAVRVGKSFRVPEHAVAAYLRSCEVDTTNTVSTSNHQIA